MIISEAVGEDGQYTIRCTTNDVPTVRPTKPAAKSPTKSRLAFLRGRRWKIYAALAITIPVVLAAGIVSYYFVSFGRLIDARMHGEFQRTDPRIFARPLTVHRTQRVTEPQMIDRLNDLGYAQRGTAERPGEFAIGRDALVAIPRGGDHPGQTIRFAFAPTTKAGASGPLQSMQLVAKNAPSTASNSRRRC